MILLFAVATIGRGGVEAGSKSDSSHPHLREADVPRLAARRGKSATVHDSYDDLSEQQLLGLVGETAGEIVQEEEEFDEEMALKEEEEDSELLDRYLEENDFWAEEEEDEDAKLYGMSIDDPRLNPDESGRYEQIADPREMHERESRSSPHPPDRTNPYNHGHFKFDIGLAETDADGVRLETDPEEAYFYRDLLDFADPFPDAPDEEINKIMPLARHGPNLDDFLEAMIEETRAYIERAGLKKIPDGWIYPVRYRSASPLSPVTNRDFAMAMLADGERDLRIGVRLKNWSG